MIEPRDIDVRIRGKLWRIRFVDGETLERIGEAGPLNGLCDPPEFARRFIRVDQSLRGRELLEFVIHELLHAALWDVAEEAVADTARDIARVLHRLRSANG